MIKPLLFVAALSMATPAVASSLGGALSASQNATNNQNNSGSVIQAPSGGSQTNINQNNAYSSTYSFGPGISCPTSSLAASVFGAGSQSTSIVSSGANSYGASFSYIHPIGGSVKKACTSLVEEIAKQRGLDTKMSIIQACAEFIKKGIVIDYKTFPEFEVCESVNVVK